MKYISRSLKQRANLMAQIASGYRIGPTIPEDIDHTKCLNFGCETLVLGKILQVDIFPSDVEGKKKDDWRKSIIQYLKNPNKEENNSLKLKARGYLLYGEPPELLKQGADGL